jgi:hypothetical protein
MLASLTPTYLATAKWLNDNQGVVGIGVFIVTLLLGWTSGIFAALRRRPKFIISYIYGPTFCCTFPTGAEFEGQTVHRTGIALYLAVANIGSAASSIDKISVGYHWHLRPFTLTWLRYGVGWFWLRNQIAAIADFQAKIGENTKVYPFLIQRSITSGNAPSTFLEPGRSTNGVVYFEQPDSWGGCFPSPVAGGVNVKVEIQDVFGHSHTTKFKIPFLALEEARKYNPSFGKTISEIRNEVLPHDKSNQTDSQHK